MNDYDPIRENETDARECEESLAEECIYCGQMVCCDSVPAPDDDASWLAEAEHHDEDCEWIITRAHRRL